jgi:hypothetical protein
MFQKVDLAAAQGASHIEENLDRKFAPIRFVFQGIHITNLVQHMERSTTLFRMTALSSSD